MITVLIAQGNSYLVSTFAWFQLLVGHVHLLSAQRARLLSIVTHGCPSDMVKYKDRINKSKYLKNNHSQLTKLVSISNRELNPYQDRDLGKQDYQD